MASPKRAALVVALTLAALVPAAAAHARPAAGLTATEVVIFDTEAPSVVLDRHAITGLDQDETIRAIDVRPENGGLYALGVTPAGAARLVTVDPGTGSATAIGAFTVPNAGASFGLDFDPVADEIRLVDSSSNNWRLDPDSAQLQQQTNLTQPLVAIAYDRNQAGAASTTLWGYNTVTDRLVRVGSLNGSPTNPDSGAVTAPANGSGVAAGSDVGFDIAPDGAGFVSADVGAVHSLYSVYFPGATLTEIGDFPEPVHDLAVLPEQSIQFDTRTPSAAESAGGARIAVTRSGNTAGTASVAYSTASGTATSSDYTPRSGTLVFLPGQTEARFDLPLARDSRAEPTETVGLTLSAPGGGASLGTPATATLNILDSHPPDRTAPRLLLAPDSRSVRLGRLLRRGLRGAWSSTEAATATFELRLRGKRTVLGNAGGSLSAGGARRFNVRVSRAGRNYLKRRLRRVKRVKLSLVLRATDLAGNRRTATVKLQVTR